MIVVTCADCPYNEGVRGEEIICAFDFDPRECLYRREGDE